jgi:hypothetical protein
MSLRNEWRFAFTANDVYLAAERLRTYHAWRNDYWNEMYSNAVEAAKAAGVQVREVDATGGKQAQVVLDPTVQADINLAQRKRNDHDAKQREYATWAAAFQLMPPTQEYRLDPEDVEFFDMTGSRVSMDIPTTGQPGTEEVPA